MDATALPKLKKTTLVEDFILRFERLIITGQFAIGDKLPSERDLAAQLGVSRPVVHEGLIDLEAKGLVTRGPTGGAVVNDYLSEGSLFVLDSLLRCDSSLVETRLARSTMDFRLLVESENARLAARLRGEAQLEALRAILAEEEGASSSDVEALSRLDLKFHRTVAQATDNIFYPLLINSFKELWLSACAVFYADPAVWPLVRGYHRQLVEAIAARDEEAAVCVMRLMIRHGRESYERSAPGGGA